MNKKLFGKLFLLFLVLCLIFALCSCDKVNANWSKAKTEKEQLEVSKQMLIEMQKQDAILERIAVALESLVSKGK
jgi:hypothetical protein